MISGKCHSDKNGGKRTGTVTGSSLFFYSEIQGKCQKKVDNALPYPPARAYKQVFRVKHRDRKERRKPAGQEEYENEDQ